MKDANKLIGGLMAGAALGIAVGLLLAPRSGDKTRKKLVNDSLKIKDDVLSTVEGSIDSLRRQFNSKFDQIARGGKEAVKEGANYANEKVNEKINKL
ncbi:MAG: YtxH domain-containing protein [Chryseolinea sp.]